MCKIITNAIYSIKTRILTVKRAILKLNTHTHTHILSQELLGHRFLVTHYPGKYFSHLIHR